MAGSLLGPPVSTFSQVRVYKCREQGLEAAVDHPESQLLMLVLVRKSGSHFSYLGSSVGIDSIASPVVCQWRLSWVESVFLHYS